MKKTLFYSSIFMLSAFFATAQEEQVTPHPIEVKSKACYDKAVSTHDMIQCADKDYTAWDKEMNKVYQALLKKVGNNLGISPNDDFIVKNIINSLKNIDIMFS